MNLVSEIVKLVFAAVALIFFIVQCCIIKPWQKKLASKSGELLLKTESPKITKNIVLLVLCPVLIILSLITRATTFVCCLMSVVAALASYISAKEIVHAKLNGVYQNAIIGSGQFVLYESIKTFPDTSWKEPDKEGTTSLAIQLNSDKRKKDSVIFIDFASIVEYVKVVNKLKEINQDK